MCHIMFYALFYRRRIRLQLRFLFHAKKKKTREMIALVDSQIANRRSVWEVSSRTTNFFLSMLGCGAIILAQLLIRQRHSKVMRQPVVIYSSALSTYSDIPIIPFLYRTRLASREFFFDHLCYYCVYKTALKYGSHEFLNLWQQSSVVGILQSIFSPLHYFPTIIYDG